MNDNNTVVVEAVVRTDLTTAWECWTSAAHIIKWNFASDDWHAPAATVDLTVGGKFVWRMEAKDGSFGFDFSGSYTSIDEPNFLDYRLDDGRMVSVKFVEEKGAVRVIESFEAENQNPVEMQKSGWQMILNNFKKYCESLATPS